MLTPPFSLFVFLSWILKFNFFWSETSENSEKNKQNVALRNIFGIGTQNVKEYVIISLKHKNDLINILKWTDGNIHIGLTQ